jgi:hypothetical protein
MGYVGIDETELERRRLENRSDVAAVELHARSVPRHGVEDPAAAAPDLDDAPVLGQRVHEIPGLQRREVAGVEVDHVVALVMVAGVELRSGQSDTGRADSTKGRRPRGS